MYAPVYMKIYVPMCMYMCLCMCLYMCTYEHTYMHCAVCLAQCYHEALHSISVYRRNEFREEGRKGTKEDKEAVKTIHQADSSAKPFKKDSGSRVLLAHACHPKIHGGGSQVGGSRDH